MKWQVASDLRERLIDHRKALGELDRPLPQAEYGRLWGRSYKAVSSWENGRGLPAPAVIEMAVTRNGWDRRMFEEGGPMPSTLSSRRPHNCRGVSQVEQVKRQIAVSAADYERRGQPLSVVVVAGWMQMLEDAIRSEGTE